MINNFVKTVLSNGGRIAPIIVPQELAKGTGQMNPSLFLDNGKTCVNLRNVQYVILHSENEQYFQSRFGPLAYMNPEDDVSLRTFNFYCEFDHNLKMVKSINVDSSKYDAPPQWEFIGLEDARLVKWDHKWYLCGVRRDTKPNGEGRMELSEIKIKSNTVKEVRRVRIEPPGEPTYCEKNWMPILDMPFHFVKWSNPTQVVKVDLDSGTSETVFLSDVMLSGYRDFRGGSSVIPYKDGHMAIIHEVVLFKDELGRKDAYYYHRFLVWDKDWRITAMSDYFDFMTGRIEFCCGLAINGDRALITFGFQDNAAYILELPLKQIEEMIYETT